MKQIALIQLKNGAVIEFDISPGNPALELDLDALQDGLNESIFSIVVEIDKRIAFSAYYWHNRIECNLLPRGQWGTIQ